MGANGGDAEGKHLNFGVGVMYIGALKIRLPREGAASFTKPWGELMAHIESKRLKLNRVTPG